MNFDDLNLPEPVRLEATALLNSIEQADGVLEMARLAGTAEGFAIALECSRALPDDIVQALETRLTAAVGKRMSKLRG